ncbi:MAG: hypothetical protein ACJAZP_003975 [Psychromonas sp.]|jgi:hypothetical protein|uniref:ATP-dependent zinc protease family protein n=1 Tax=Psychromonas sp. TaxID=1884585 RepID=UPI0039E351F6
MLLNKTVLFTALVVFMTTGCVNYHAQEQQLQITNLQADLFSAQQTFEQTQAELSVTNEALSASKIQVNELNDLLTTSTAKLTAEKAAIKQAAKQAAVKNDSAKFGNKAILGQTEWVYVSAIKRNFRARVDTGATTASISATDIERFERDGEKWVRFNLDNEKNTEPQNIEARIVRFVSIIQANDPGEKDSRLVVNLHVRIGGVVGETEFTLTDRTHMEYPILIGRTFLQDVAVVDVSKEYLHTKFVEKSATKK